MEMVCGMVMFAGMTQLDLTGPYEVLCRVPGVKVRLLSVDGKKVRTEWGMVIEAEGAFAEVEKVDMICVPGGTGVNETLTDARYVKFVRRVGTEARWVTSVCTGALLLGASGLLKGYRATTHWRSVEFLSAFGA